MAITEVLNMVPPPTHPAEVGDINAWRAFEERMGLQFPSDWYDLMTSYGTGSFGGSHELEILNPFSRNFRQALNSELDLLRMVEHYDAAGDSYPTYPSQPGLFPWARDANGYGLHWYTAGTPDEWPIVVTIAREEETGEYQMSMTTFLAKAFQGEIQEPLRYEPLSAINRLFVPILPRS